MPRLRFFLDHAPLPFHAPAVAGKSAIAPDHTMARDSQGNCVGRAGVRDGTDCVRVANAGGQRSVSNLVADPNTEQGAPDAPLKGCSATARTGFAKETFALWIFISVTPFHWPVPPICGNGQQAWPPDFRWDETPGDEGIERDGGVLIRQVSVAECAGSQSEKGISGQFAWQQT